MAPSEDSGRRNPSVLVTDSRNQQHSQRPSSRRSAVPPATRLITVDNVLQYASDVPSMRQRRPPPPPQQRPQMRSPRSRLSSSAGLASSTGMMAGGGGMGGVAGSVPAGRLTAQARLPPRSTKVTEKLVLLPETQTDGAEDIEGEGGEGPAVRMLDEETVQRLARERNIEPETLRRQLLDDLAARRQQQRLVGGDFDEDNELAPLLAEEERLRRRRVPPEKAKSYAERLPKARRAEQLPRVTAYCTAQGYKMGPTAAFVKEWHGARTKLYDDCLYTAYHLPLLPGRNGYRVRSSPVLKSAGGKVVLDEEIERNEQRDYHEEYPGEAHEHSVGGGRGQPATDAVAPPDQQPGPHSQTLGKPGPGRPRISPNVFHIAEMFVFSYGVVVFWNFTEHQEKDILADLTFSSTTPSSPGQPSLAPSVPLATNPLAEEDFETEEFHFEYSTEIPRPRVYNDMITLRSGDHMIKLAISHAIAQSTKLCFFEEAMAKEMADAKDIPRRLATEGKLGMKRDEVFRILGRLFKSRVEVNLSSNMLDVPTFFWESEPTLYPLYIAVREYLEIKPRIQVLNERCRVFLDLTEILSDSIADANTSNQTWIIIVLIIISIFVTIGEVILRFGLLTSGSSNEETGGGLARTTNPRNLSSYTGCECSCDGLKVSSSSSSSSWLLQALAGLVRS